MLQLQLRRFEDDLFLARVILRERLVAIARSAVQRQVNVGVDETGQDELPRAVDDGRARGNRRRRSRPRRGDPSVGDQDDAVGDRRATVAVNQRRAGDGSDAPLCESTNADDRRRDRQTQTNTDRMRRSCVARIGRRSLPLTAKGAVLLPAKYAGRQRA